MAGVGVVACSILVCSVAYTQIIDKLVYQLFYRYFPFQFPVSGYSACGLYRLVKSKQICEFIEIAQYFVANIQQIGICRILKIRRI